MSCTFQCKMLSRLIVYTFCSSLNVDFDTDFQNSVKLKIHECFVGDGTVLTSMRKLQAKC